ncbi:MAG TPA: flagellar filament capping protein FliD [Egibacteraceae bacterium]|nr:flagellar filament capping protein FliD [Egibacteraceae bacterium]
MSAVDGLISGMDTSAVIRQLMQLERQPVVRLQSRKTTADRAITALQNLNTKFLALADLARKLHTTSGWSRVQTTSSHADLLRATAADGTAPTSLTFRVGAVAAAHQIYSAATYASADTQVAQSGRTITVSYTDEQGAAQSLVVDNHDGTLQSIATALNTAEGSPITARVVKTSDAGNYRLELTAKRTGASSAFTVTGIRQPPSPEMAFSVASQASDAQLLFGSSATPMTISSSTNTFTGVAPGLTLDVLKAEPGTTVTVSITRDGASLGGDVEKLVAAANEILRDLKTATGFDPATKRGGALRGNTSVRDLQNAVLTAVASAVGGVSAAGAGLELTRDGTLKFDRAVFDKAYAADPAAVAALFSGGDGIATRLKSLSEGATKYGTGTLTSAIELRRNEIRRIDDAIAGWDVRLAVKEKRLRAQFAALETALGNAQQQSNWLAGQLASLPKINP